MYYADSLSGMGQTPQAEGCAYYARVAGIYEKLSQKSDKKKETRQNAANIAQQNWALHQKCLNDEALKAAGVNLSPIEAAQPEAVQAQPKPQGYTQAMIAPISQIPGQMPQIQTGAAPSAKKQIPWLWIAVGVAVVGAGAWYYFKKRKRG